jgi:hypothetical protein
MKSRIALALAAMLAVFLCTQPALSACGQRSEIVSQLLQKYNEKQIGIGLAKDGKIVEIFVSPDTNSFTILLSTATGESCIASYGKPWQSHGFPKVTKSD